MEGTAAQANEIPLVEAAMALGDYHTTWQAVVRGVLKARKVGGRWRVSRESLEQLIEQRSAGDRPRAA